LAIRFLHISDFTAREYAEPIEENVLRPSYDSDRAEPKKPRRLGRGLSKGGGRSKRTVHALPKLRWNFTSKFPINPLSVRAIKGVAGNQKFEGSGSNSGN
jgi:hypothetical protein